MLTAAFVTMVADEVGAAWTRAQILDVMNDCQNEILGELEKEFGSGPDGGAEMPLSELAKAVGGKYKGLGKVGAALVAKTLSAKLPGGFGAAEARSYLASEHGLGAGRTDSVLLHAATMAPDARLAGEADAKAWLDSVVSAYASHHGVSLQRAGAAGAGAGAGGALSPELLALLLGGGGGGSGGGGGGARGPVPDGPLTAIEFIRALLATKRSLPLAGKH